MYGTNASIALPPQSVILQMPSADRVFPFQLFIRLYGLDEESVGAVV